MLKGLGLEGKETHPPPMRMNILLSISSETELNSHLLGLRRVLCSDMPVSPSQELNVSVNPVEVWKMSRDIHEQLHMGWREACEVSKQRALR